MKTKTPETFHIPKDWQSRPEFRFLEVDAGFQAACAVFLVLWRELAYLAEIQRLGFIRSEQAVRVIEREFRKPDGNAFERDPIGTLVKATILLECEDGYECRAFAVHNAHLGVDFVNPAGKGAFFSGLKAKRAYYDREAREQINTLDRSRFVRPNAEPMTEEEIRRVIMLIKLIDNVYGRVARTPREYSPGLIADAYRVSIKHRTDLISGVCYVLASKRKRFDQSIPGRTEEALRNFDLLVKSWGRIGIAQCRLRQMQRHEKAKSSTATAID